MKKNKNSEILELEQFLNNHLDVADQGWPRLCRNTSRADAKGRVLVRGNLVLDLPVKLNLTTAQLVRALKESHEKIRCDWQFGMPIVGGFVGHVAPVAADLGFEVHISCNAAVPAPKPIMTFLECGRFDTSKVVVFPGATPGSIELQCIDGQLLIPRQGIDGAAPVPTVGKAAGEFNGVLLNPGAVPGRSELLAQLNSANVNLTATTGIVARGDWTREDLHCVPNNGRGAWLFFNRKEAIESARRIAAQASIESAKQAAIELKAYVADSTRVVVTQGKNGAWLVNGQTEPQRFPTTPVSNGRSVGAGDTFACVATLASVAGLGDDAALQMAISAAARRVAGLPAITKSLQL